MRPPPPPPADSPERPLGDRERYVAFAFTAADLLVETDLDGRMTFAAGAFRLHFGETPEAFLGRPLSELIAPSHRLDFLTACSLLPMRGRMGATVLPLASRTPAEFVVSGLHLDLAGSAPRLCFCIGPKPALVDAGTILFPNPNQFLRDAEMRLRSTLTTGAPPVDLGLIEVVGPAMPSLRDLMRAEIGPSAISAELGPGRFGLMPAHGGNPLDISLLLRRLETLLSQEAPGSSVHSAALPLSAPSLSPHQAVRALRHGLAAFTRDGHGPAAGAFSNGLVGLLNDITERAACARRAIAQRRFHLDYQPIIELSDRRTHHFEALLRPERGVLGATEGPQDFITIVEAAGLSEELDLAVLQMALGATSALGPGQRVAVNVSGLSMQSGNFRRELVTMLDASSKAGCRLMIELTESAEIEDEAEAVQTVNALRERGIPVCLDDFGAGAAAFRYLKAFQVDYVKVDGAFVEAAARSERDRSFVAAMVDLSVAVGARVVAERIETSETAELMHSLGVQLGQGWLFGKPGELPRAKPALRSARRHGTLQESWS